GGTTILTANPASGYSFSRWEIVSGTGARLANETSASTTFTMGTGNAVVRAVYTQNTHSLTLQASPTAGGNPTAGSASIVEGGTTILTANPASGYSFSRWEIVSGTGARLANETSASTTFTMGNTDAIIRAVYETNAISKNPIRFIAIPSSGGMPSAEEPSLAPGESTTIHANPNPGYRFVEWVQDPVSNVATISDLTSEITTLTMGEFSGLVRAVYEQEDTYSLELQASPSSGGDPKSTKESVLSGEKATITANPNNGYSFVRWELVSGDGAIITDPELETAEFTMGTSNSTVRAVYKEIEVKPIKPVDPLDPETEVDPENKPELPEDQGLLSIDFVSSFDFDTQVISVHDQTYFAKPQRLLNEDGTVNETKERPNYIQISDRRAESERNGWQLAVTQAAPFTGEDGQVLTGAQLGLSNQELISAQTNAQHPSLQLSNPISLVPGNKRTLLRAEGGEGEGTWIYRFGDQQSAQESVTLSVPGSANPDATRYETTLVWELSVVPGN
ncbi:WxL domain-containing protein, partial [Enterococcus innesii]|uniref:WxL domain-containing protein n=1 Tax=Enterococcus innesii TaxID=2839759 RepID=UPI003985431B